MSKPRVIKDYEKLPPEVMEQIKLVYPLGFNKHLVSFVNREGERQMGLPFETEDYYYLIRMTAIKAKSIIRNDDDYDEDGVLKASAKSAILDKYDDLDFLDEYNSNDDNDLGFDGDDDLDEIVDPGSLDDED